MKAPFVIAIIPAKNESTRLPGKNVSTVLGKPLLVHTIESAKRCSWIQDVYVSTDSTDIADLAKQNGAQVVMRSHDLGGETPIVDVYRHALLSIHDDRVTHVVGLQPDHPDRTCDLGIVISYVVEKNVEDVMSVDNEGNKNGSLRILKADALRNNRISVYASTIRDNATNVHTLRDLRFAEVRLDRKNKPLEIVIKNKIISKTSPTFIVAEGACNHMCDISLAKKIIDEAEQAGADAVKFQTYKAERLVSKEVQSYWNYGTNISQYQYYKNLDKFDQSEYRILFNYAKTKSVVVFSTPFDIQSAEMLHELGMPLFKVASCSITDLRLIKRMASFRKPIILSTGGSDLTEIEEAVETVYATGNSQLIILACSLSYPTKPEDANLLKIRRLTERFPEAIIGLSDHTEPDEFMVIPSVAVGLGAKVIEKHFTLDRTMTGSGHAFSVDPISLKKMVTNIRVAEKILGSENLHVRDAEQKARENARFSIVASHDLRRGTVLKEEDLSLKRPGTGMLPKYFDLLIGKPLLRDLKGDEPLAWKDVDHDTALST